MTATNIGLIFLAATISAVPMLADPITIKGTGAIFATGTLNAPYGGSIMPQSQGANQLGDAFSFNRLLGTLLQSQVLVNTTFSWSPSYLLSSTIPKGGTILSYAITENFTTLTPYGLSNIVIPISPDTTVTCPYSACGPANSGPVSTMPQVRAAGATGTTGLLNGNSPGSIGFTVDTPITAGAGTFTGDWSLVGTANVSLTYQPNTPQQYLQYAIANTAPEQSRADFANLAAGLLGSLRRWDAATSSKNLNLRDAEYWLLGYAGGEANRFELGSTQVYNIILSGGPVSILGWKSLPSIPGNLPGTGVGGFYANWDGLEAGFNNTDINTAVANYGNNSLTSTGSGLNPNDPLVPFKDIPGSSPNGIFDNFMFNFAVPGAGASLFIDPPSAELYAYGIAGNEITGLGLPRDSGPYKLTFSGGTFSLNPGDSFSFLPYASGGIDSFTLAWSGAGDPPQRPLVDLQFLNAGQTLLDITSSQPLSDSAPEPSSAILMVAGFAAVALLRRRRQPR